MIEVKRRIDPLGRIVIPIEARRQIDVRENETLIVTVEGDRIVLRKDKKACVFCGSGDQIEAYKEVCVCAKCLNDLRNIENDTLLALDVECQNWKE